MSVKTVDFNGTQILVTKIIEKLQHLQIAFCINFLHAQAVH